MRVGRLAVKIGGISPPVLMGKLVEVSFCSPHMRGAVSRPLSPSPNSQLSPRGQAVGRHGHVPGPSGNLGAGHPRALQPRRVTGERMLLLPLLRGKDGAWGKAGTAGLGGDLGAGGRSLCR